MIGQAVTERLWSLNAGLCRQIQPALPSRAAGDITNPSRTGIASAQCKASIEQAVIQRPPGAALGRSQLQLEGSAFPLTAQTLLESAIIFILKPPFLECLPSGWYRPECGGRTGCATAC